VELAAERVGEVELVVEHGLAVVLGGLHVDEELGLLHLVRLRVRVRVRVRVGVRVGVRVRARVRVRVRVRIRVRVHLVDRDPLLARGRRGHRRGGARPQPRVE